MKYLSLSIRDLKRYKKRTIITVLIISLGFVALGVINGMLTNIFSRLEEQAVVFERQGHMTIAKKGYFEYGKINPGKYIIEENEYQKINNELRKIDEIKIISPALNLFGVLNHKDNSAIFISESIIPENDSLIINTLIDTRLSKLSVKSLDNSIYKVSIGSELAKSLNVKTGDDITLLTSTLDEMPNALDFEVGEIYNTGNPATNDKFVLMNYQASKELLDTNGAQKIIITLNDSDDISQIRSQLNESLKKYDLEIKTWQETSNSYSKVKQMFTIIFRVLTIIISSIVFLTVLNTMYIIINERSRELGIFRSLGMKKLQAVKLLTLEGFLIGLLACLLAIPLLFIVSFVLKALDIKFIPPVASAPIPVLLLINGSTVLLLTLVFLLVSTLGSFLTIYSVLHNKTIFQLLKSKQQ